MMETTSTFAPTHHVDGSNFPPTSLMGCQLNVLRAYFRYGIEDVSLLFGNQSCLDCQSEVLSWLPIF